MYLPLGTPSDDWYGGHRLGDNLFAESLVALDADTGERVWHFQAVHHGVWDYDFPTAPNLVDIVVDGRPIKAVVQVSKQAFAYVLDRVTGEPVWPIEERPVPPSTVPGERLSPTQPFPTKPPAFDRQGVTIADDPNSSQLGVMRAFDKATGAVVWEHPINTSPRGAPMTYLHEDKQYLVLGVGGGDSPPGLRAYALPD